MITEAIDFRYLLIENYRKLKLSENEVTTIFVIDHLIGQGNPFITADLLSLKMTLDVKEIDKILAKRNEAVTAVVALMISDETIRKRIKGRAVIEGRADDANDETISNRIRTYHAQTEPLKEYYQAAGKYYECDGDNGTIEDNRNRVLALVESIK